MPIENSTLNNYYYQKQIKKYLIQFMAIFSGLQVAIGKNDNNSETDLMKVPIVYGPKDRVVAAIKANNSPNVPVRLPVLTCKILDIEMANDRMKGQGTKYRSKSFPRGGSFPEDIYGVEKLMPIPYYFGMELNVLASNEDQHFQILEQLFILFRPDLYFSTSDDSQDWTSINTVKFNNITLEDNYPPGAERRIISTNMNFQFLAYMSAPANVRDNLINSIKLRLQTLSEIKDFDNFREEAASKSIENEYDNIFDISDLNPPER